MTDSFVDRCLCPGRHKRKQVQTRHDGVDEILVLIQPYFDETLVIVENDCSSATGKCVRGLLTKHVTHMATWNRVKVRQDVL